MTWNLFLDESGTTNYLDPIAQAQAVAQVAGGTRPTVPVHFALAGVLFSSASYAQVATQLAALKTRHFDTAAFCLHEYELRSGKIAPYSLLRPQAAWDAFITDLTAFAAHNNFKIIVVMVDKVAMADQYAYPEHPYKYCLHVLLERVVYELPTGVTCKLTAEDRDVGMNSELSQELLRLQLQGGGFSQRTVSAEDFRKTFDPVIAFRKKMNCDPGLEIADLAVGPILRHFCGLERGTRLVAPALIPRIRAKFNGQKKGWGLVFLPRAPANYTE